VDLRNYLDQSRFKDRDPTVKVFEEGINPIFDKDSTFYKERH
jgi:hypothetical protein